MTNELTSTVIASELRKRWPGLRVYLTSFGVEVCGDGLIIALWLHSDGWHVANGPYVADLAAIVAAVREAVAVRREALREVES